MDSWAKPPWGAAAAVLSLRPCRREQEDVAVPPLNTALVYLPTPQNDSGLRTLPTVSTGFKGSLGERALHPMCTKAKK